MHKQITENARDDAEHKFLDYLRHKYPTTQAFIEYAERCYKKNTHSFPDYLSALSRDIRRLILNSLSFYDVLHLASTCHKMLAILNDDVYWFNRHRRDFYSRPVVGDGSAVVMVQRKRKTISIRWFDIYTFKYFTTGSYRFRTLKTFLEARHGLRIASLPVDIGYHYYLRYPMDIWPSSVIDVVKLCPHAKFSLFDIAYRLCDFYYKDDLNLVPIIGNVPEIDKTHNQRHVNVQLIMYNLQKVMLAHIWDNVVWNNCKETVEASAITNKVKVI